MTFCRTWCQRKPFLVRFPLGKSRLIMLLKQKSGKKVSQLTSKTVYWITLKCTLTSKASISWYFQVVKPLLYVCRIFLLFSCSLRLLFQRPRTSRELNLPIEKNPMNYFFGFLTLENQSLNNSVGHVLRENIFPFFALWEFFSKSTVALTLPLPEAISKYTFLAEYAPSSLLSHGIRWENVKLNVTTFKREQSISQWSRPPSASKVKQN